MLPVNCLVTGTLADAVEYLANRAALARTGGLGWAEKRANMFSDALTGLGSAGRRIGEFAKDPTNAPIVMGAGGAGLGALGGGAMGALSAMGGPDDEPEEVRGQRRRGRMLTGALAGGALGGGAGLMTSVLAPTAHAKLTAGLPAAPPGLPGPPPADGGPRPGMIRYSLKGKLLPAAFGGGTGEEKDYIDIHPKYTQTPGGQKLVEQALKGPQQHKSWPGRAVDLAKELAGYPSTWLAGGMGLGDVAIHNQRLRLGELGGRWGKLVPGMMDPANVTDPKFVRAGLADMKSSLAKRLLEDRTIYVDAKERINDMKEEMKALAKRRIGGWATPPGGEGREAFLKNEIKRLKTIPEELHGHGRGGRALEWLRGGPDRSLSTRSPLKEKALPTGATSSGAAPKYKTVEMTAQQMHNAKMRGVELEAQKLNDGKSVPLSKIRVRSSGLFGGNQTVKVPGNPGLKGRLLTRLGLYGGTLALPYIWKGLTGALGEDKEIEKAQRAFATDPGWNDPHHVAVSQNLDMARRTYGQGK